MNEVNDKSCEQLMARELAQRSGDGVEVTLFWWPVDGRLTVAVAELDTGSGFEIAVAGRRPLDVFYHPYAYAPRQLPLEDVQRVSSETPAGLDRS